MDILETYRVSVGNNENIPEAYKNKFEEFLDYLGHNYSDNTDQWSTMIFPETEQDKNAFYCCSNNGLESLNRCLNRFVKTYAKGNLTVLGRYLQQFMQHQIDEVELIKNGQKSCDVSKLSSVSLSESLQ